MIEQIPLKPFITYSHLFRSVILEFFLQIAHFDLKIRKTYVDNWEVENWEQVFNTKFEML